MNMVDPSPYVSGQPGGGCKELNFELYFTITSLLYHRHFMYSQQNLVTF